MPLTLNVGHSRKVGEPNYSSRGASVHLEIEVEGNLIHDPQRLRESIRNLFVLARTAVEDELNVPAAQNGRPSPNRNGNGAARATASQLRAIQTLTRRREIDLPTLLGERYGHTRPEELSLTEASALIHDLNTAPDRAGGRQ